MKISMDRDVATKARPLVVGNLKIKAKIPPLHHLRCSISPSLVTLSTNDMIN